MATPSARFAGIPSENGSCQAKPQRDLNPTTRYWHSWLRSIGNKMRSESPSNQLPEQIIQLAPHFNVLDIWSGSGIDLNLSTLLEMDRFLPF
jgi:hypothetical protein